MGVTRERLSDMANKARQKKQEKRAGARFLLRRQRRVPLFCAAFIHPYLAVPGRFAAPVLVILVWLVTRTDFSLFGHVATDHQHRPQPS
jgi:hypothetical protein